MSVETEINLCKMIFKEKIEIQGNTIDIQTPYGTINIVISENYPQALPKIVVKNDLQSKNDSQEFLKKILANNAGNFMIYPIILAFYNFHEQYNKRVIKQEQKEIFETSFDIVEESDLKMTENEFFDWIKAQNKIQVNQKGITGKKYFETLKPENFTEKAEI